MLLAPRRELSSSLLYQNRKGLIKNWTPSFNRLVSDLFRSSRHLGEMFSFWFDLIWGSRRCLFLFCWVLQKCFHTAFCLGEPGQKSSQVTRALLCPLHSFNPIRKPRISNSKDPDSNFMVSTSFSSFGISLSFFLSFFLSEWWSFCTSSPLQSPLICSRIAEFLEPPVCSGDCLVERVFVLQDGLG